MDYTLNINVDGQKADRKLDDLVKEMNESQKAAEKNRQTTQRLAAARRELAQYARKEREEAFNKLSIEEKTNRLLERREQIARRLANASTDERRLMLRLAQRRNEGRIADLQGGGIGDMFKQDILGRMFAGIPGGGILQKIASGLSLSRLFGAGAIGLGGLGAKKGLDIAGDIADLADRIDSTPRGAQRLSFSAGSTKGDLGSFIRIVENIRKAQSEALQGGADNSFAKDFKRLGISSGDLKNKTAEDFFYQIAGGIKNGQINAGNYSSVLAIMGRESKEMMPAFKNGVKEAADEFDRLNLAIRSGTIRALDDLGDKSTSVFATMKAGLKKLLVETVGGGISLGKLLLAGNPLIGGQTREDLLLSRELQNDKDYQDSLDLTQKLEAKLGQKTENKRNEAEAKAKYWEEVAGKGSSSGSRGSITFNPDQLALMGGIRGGQTSVATMNFAREALQKVNQIELSIKEINHKLSDFKP